MAAFNRHDVDAALSFYAPDYTDQTAGHEGGGIEALRGMMAQLGLSPAAHHSHA